MSDRRDAGRQRPDDRLERFHNLARKERVDLAISLVGRSDPRETVDVGYALLRSKYPEAADEILRYGAFNVYDQVVDCVVDLLAWMELSLREGEHDVHHGILIDALGHLYSWLVLARGVGNGRSPKKPKKDAPRISRLARLLALAHHFDDLLRHGAVRDCAEIARLMGVSRAHVTHIMDLLFLAPGTQEEILFSTAGPKGGASASPRRTRRVSAEAACDKQRKLWHVLRQDLSVPSASTCQPTV